MVKQFKINIVLRYPQKNINIDFIDPVLSADISAAAAYYNKRYGNIQNITILNISKSVISLELDVIANNCNQKLNPSRLISAFSRFLYNKRNWSRFSRVNNRLFELIEIVDLSQGNNNNNIVLQWLHITQKLIAYEIDKLEQQTI